MTPRGGYGKNTEGIVIDARPSRFKVLCGERTITCVPRGKLKLVGEDILVGDRVDIVVDNKGFGSIESVQERRNRLIRPYVSNIDILLIVIAKVPEPDLILVDKLIVNANMQNIRPILCVNKNDDDGCELFADIKRQYSGILDIVSTSCVTGDGIVALSEMLRGEATAIAGQSAVGKSSILNALLGRNAMDIGELSERIERGKNTTRHVRLFMENGLALYDTCGFSAFEFPPMPPEKLSFYYDDFAPFVPECKFRSCQHLDEPECGVKNAVEKGLIPLERFERYVIIEKELQDMWRKQYDG